MGCSAYSFKPKTRDLRNGILTRLRCWWWIGLSRSCTYFNLLRNEKTCGRARWDWKEITIPISVKDSFLVHMSRSGTAFDEHIARNPIIQWLWMIVPRSGTHWIVIESCHTIVHLCLLALLLKIGSCWTCIFFIFDICFSGCFCFWCWSWSFRGPWLYLPSLDHQLFMFQQQVALIALIPSTGRNNIRYYPKCVV